MNKKSKNRSEIILRIEFINDTTKFLRLVQYLKNKCHFNHNVHNIKKGTVFVYSTVRVQNSSICVNCISTHLLGNFKYPEQSESTKYRDTERIVRMVIGPNYFEQTSSDYLQKIGHILYQQLRQFVDMTFSLPHSRKY